ncbi:MAG: hypothetical protein WBO92_01360 [Candidatus Moraniibacteriota bacterium]
MTTEVALKVIPRAGSASNEAQHPSYERRQVYQFPSGVQMRITAVVYDLDREEVILVLESKEPLSCISDLSVSEFRALNPVRVEGGD